MSHRLNLHLLVAVILLAALTSPLGALNLRHLAGLARERNLSLKIARLDLEESWIDQRIAENSFIPDAELKYNQGLKRSFDDQQQALYGTNSRTSLFSLTITQEFKALGKYNEWQRDITRLKTKAKERLQERADLEVVRRLIRVYFQMAKQEGLARIHEFNLGLIGQLLEIGRLNQQVGLALQRDVLRIEVQQANTQAALLRARHDFTNFRLDLANLLNFQDTASPTVELPCSLKFPLVEVDASGSRILLLERDLDLVLARNDLMILEKTLAAARSAGKPTFNLDGAYNHGFQNGPLKNSRDYTVGFSLSAPIYDSHDRVNEIRRYEKLLAKANLALQELEAASRLSLEKAFADYDEARQRIAFAEKALEQSRENMRVVGIRFKAGDAPIADLVDAQFTFSSSAETAVNAYYDERIRLAEIFLLTRQNDLALALDQGAFSPLPQAIDLTGDEPGVSPDIPAMFGNNHSEATPSVELAGSGTALVRPHEGTSPAASESSLLPGPVMDLLLPIMPVLPPAPYITPDQPKDANP